MPLEFLYSRSSDIKPTQELIKHVVGHSDYGEFLKSGAAIYTIFDLACRRFDGRSLDEFGRILDFGCGIGRILQFIRSMHAVSACDVYEPAVRYLNKAFYHADAYANDLSPPLKYASDTFDLVYSFSVFSHLTQIAENEWLDELARVGKKSCLYLITVHGDWWIEATLGEERQSVVDAGFFFKSVYDRSTRDAAFPEYYEASYHTSEYIRRNWTKIFDVVDIISGRTAHEHLIPGMHFEPEGSVSPFGPMGQDLVIMRKR